MPCDAIAKRQHTRAYANTALWRFCLACNGIVRDADCGGWDMLKLARNVAIIAALLPLVCIKAAIRAAWR